ncbi:hypothetical protein TcWFU_006945 [Taenia crassiceps]|uniref:Elongator complex protein 6 n=1 Tax=Taenia crassiceps TaxID=6207 RepID=A0ABR4Q2Y2_9CEST
MAKDARINHSKALGGCSLCNFYLVKMLKLLLGFCAGFYCGAYYQDKYKITPVSEPKEAVDLCALLTQEIPIPAERPLPYLIFVTSLGLSASHEEVFVTTISGLLSSAGVNEQATTSLLIAAKQPVERYMTHLTSLLHRSEGRHKVTAFDLSESFHASPVMQSGEDLYNDLRERVTIFINSVEEGRKPLIFLDDLSVLTDLGVPSNRFLGFLLVSNLHYLVIGYHGNRDGVSDDFLLHLARRRAELCVDVRPLDTGYSDTIDGQLTISQRHQEHSEDGPARPTKFHFRAVDRRIQCFYPGASNLNLRKLVFTGFCKRQVLFRSIPFATTLPMSLTYVEEEANRRIDQPRPSTKWRPTTCRCKIHVTKPC